MRDECWYCGGKLVWMSDFDYADVYGEGEGIVTYLSCSECGAEVEYVKKENEGNLGDSARMYIN